MFPLAVWRSRLHALQASRAGSKVCKLSFVTHVPEQFSASSSYLQLPEYDRTHSQFKIHQPEEPALNIRGRKTEAQEG